MKKYLCGPCGYVYDPAGGDPDNGIVPGKISLTIGCVLSAVLLNPNLKKKCQ